MSFIGGALRNSFQNESIWKSSNHSRTGLCSILWRGVRGWHAGHPFCLCTPDRVETRCSNGASARQAPFQPCPLLAAAVRVRSSCPVHCAWHELLWQTKRHIHPYGQSLELPHSLQNTASTVGARGIPESLASPQAPTSWASMRWECMGLAVQSTGSHAEELLI